MTSEIRVSFNNNDNNITINIPNKKPITNPIPTDFDYKDDNNLLYSGSKLQYLMRKLDCLKDAKEGEGITDKKEIMNKIFSNPEFINFTSFDSLNNIKKKLFDKNVDRIDNDSWLKSSSSTVNYNYIQNVFYETGLGPEDYIVDLKNTNQKVFNMIGSFPSEIGDPGSRKVEKFDIRFPSLNTTILFDPSFMNYFGFGPETSYKATLKSDNNKVGSYDYSIDLGNTTNQVNNLFFAENINAKGNGSLMNRFSTTKFKGTEFTSCNKDFPLEKNVSADEYFKGNNYKNSLINKLYREYPNDNIPEIKRYIMAKEMGDVMQVLIMMIWQMVQQNSNKKNYCMITLDSIVYMLCLLLEQPCMYTHTSNKGIISEDKCYRIQYYFPAVITEEERMRTRFQQKYTEIYFNNLKIKNFLNRIFIEKVIYKGNYEINYDNKSNIINTYFINPINAVFESISLQLEEYNENKKMSSSLTLDDLKEMHNKYNLLPIFGLREKGKKKYNYINPGISNYTENLVYTYEGIEKPSFLEVFEKLNSGTLPFDKEITGRKRRMNGGSVITSTMPPLNNSSSDDFIVPSLKNSNNSDNVDYNDKDFVLSDAIKDNLAEEDKIIHENEVVNENGIPEKGFFEKLSLTFISQVVDNLNNNSDLKISQTLDQDALYYYYYDMLVYLSYIQQKVYYDENLLEQMKKLKLYADKGTSLSEILNNPLPLNEELEDTVVEGCELKTSSIPSGLNYLNELLDTLNAMNNEVLKTDAEIQKDYKDMKSQPSFDEEEQNFDEEELSSDKMELESDENELESDENVLENNQVELEPMLKEENPVTPADQIITEGKKRSSSSSIDIPASKMRRISGGKTKKRTVVKRKNKKTKRSIAKKKRTIKKKASRRKHKKTVKRRK